MPANCQAMFTIFLGMYGGHKVNIAWQLAGNVDLVATIHTEKDCKQDDVFVIVLFTIFLGMYGGLQKGELQEMRCNRHNCADLENSWKS